MHLMYKFDLVRLNDSVDNFDYIIIDKCKIKIMYLLFSLTHTHAEVLGFDTKSTPSCPPSIIQLSTQDQCFVWRIRQNVKYSTSKSTWLSPELTKILTSEKILKVMTTTRTRTTQQMLTQ